QSELDDAARARVEVHPLNVAEMVAGSIDRTQIHVGIEESLNVVIAGRKSVKVREREYCSGTIDRGNDTRTEIFNVTSEDRRGLHTGFTDSQPWFGPIRTRDDDEEAPRCRAESRCDFKPKRFNARKSQPQKCTKTEDFLSLWRSFAAHFSIGCGGILIAGPRWSLCGMNGPSTNRNFTM